VVVRLVEAGEEDRRRIADSIHDDSIQIMTAASMRLQILRRSLDDPKVLQPLDELDKMVRLSISHLRQLLFELRPPALDHDGIGAAICSYLDTLADVSTSFRLDDRMISQPSDATRIIVYRILQDVLTNVVRHSSAKTAVITLVTTDGGGCHARIVDDGVGFALVPPGPAPPRPHLDAIRGRAELAGGWSRVRSAPTAGTTVEIWVPWAATVHGGAGFSLAERADS